MRDWPEPDQDTLLDILEVWDLGDYEEARAERAEAEYYEEQAKAEEAEANTQDEDNLYTDWEPPNTCPCCDTQYCQSMYYDALGAQYDNEYDYYQKESDKAWKECRIAKLNADAANARSDILQAKANVARIKANIAVFKSQIAYNNYLSCQGDPRGEECYTADAENQLVNAEANLVEAKTVLADARTIGAAHATVVRAHNYVKYAEARVQAKKDAKDLAIEIRETSEREYHVEELNLLAEGAHVEYILFPEQQNGIIEIGFCREDVHIKYVNALIELAEAKDALDLAETLLAKTPSLSLTHGYGFSSREPRCSTSGRAE